MKTQREPAATVLLTNEEGLFLGVSRKDDHTKFGLVGGKLDEGESFENAIKRECLEETGLEIYDLKLVLEINWKERHNQTFTAKWKGEIHTDEPHVVKWITKEELFAGPFGEYNKLLFETMGLS